MIIAHTDRNICMLPINAAYCISFIYFLNGIPLIVFTSDCVKL